VSSGGGKLFFGFWFFNFDGGFDDFDLFFVFRFGGFGGFGFGFGFGFFVGGDVDWDDFAVFFVDGDDDTVLFFEIGD